MKAVSCESDPEMDRLSSPTSIPSSPTVAQTPAPKQPTYTTAGTIYNPNSSQPLQPPARRGRSFKWATDGTPSDLTLLPKSVLASLPLRGAATHAPVHQQYSPLQQNYDRAVSPSLFRDADHLLANMPLQGLATRAGSITPDAFSSLVANSGEDESSSEDESPESDSESDLGMDPLKGMTVKSLHNLASYPNPNQKRAQKTLLQGAKATLQGPGLVGRGHSSSSPSTIRPIGSPPKRGASSSDTLLLSGSDPSIHGQDSGSARERSTPSRDDTYHSTHPMISTAAASTDILDPKPSASTLAKGPGAPQPLTAGPPGQRQYRPSTFESTFKALQSRAQQQKGPLLDDDIFNSPSHDLLQAESQGWHPFQDSSTAGLQVHEPASPATRSTTTTRGRIFQEEYVSKIMITQGEKREFLSRLHYQDEASTMTAILGQSLDPNWRDPKPESRLRLTRGTDRLTKEEIRARNKKAEQCWYAGADILSKTAAESVVDERIRKFGAIGDGRPNKGKNPYPALELEEANRMDTSEHAKPLLNMTFATLLRDMKAWKKDFPCKGETSPTQMDY